MMRGLVKLALGFQKLTYCVSEHVSILVGDNEHGVIVVARKEWRAYGAVFWDRFENDAI
jgi:hypothetical protein